MKKQLKQKDDPGLTRKELEVYEYIAYSKETLPVMAESLGIAEGTLYIHLASIRRKKNAVDKADIVRTYFLEKDGLVEPETQRKAKVVPMPFMVSDNKVVPMFTVKEKAA